MENKKYNFDFIDKQKSFYRKSFLIKITFGTSIICSAASCISLYLVLAGFQSKRYISNFSKGCIILNISLLCLNELYYALFVYLKLYENFCITYFLSGMSLYSSFVNTLIRKNGMNYFEAKFYAKKNLLYLISLWITFELILKIKKKNLTYDESDIIDTVESYYKELNTKPKFDDLIQLRIEISKIVEKEQEKSIVINKFNSIKKKQELKNYIKITGKNTYDMVDFIIYYLYLNFKEKEFMEKSLI